MPAGITGQVFNLSEMLMVSYFGQRYSEYFNFFHALVLCSDTVRGFYLLLKEKTTDAKQIERENSAVRGR